MSPVGMGMVLKLAKTGYFDHTSPVVLSPKPTLLPQPTKPPPPLPPPLPPQMPPPLIAPMESPEPFGGLFLGRNFHKRDDPLVLSTPLKGQPPPSPMSPVQKKRKLGELGVGQWTPEQHFQAGMLYEQEIRSRATGGRPTRYVTTEDGVEVRLSTNQSEAAAITAAFYPGVDENVILRCLKDKREWSGIVLKGDRYVQLRITLEKRSQLKPIAPDLPVDSEFAAGLQRLIQRAPVKKRPGRE